MSEKVTLSGLTKDGKRDQFFYLCAMNRATVVINTKIGLLTEEKARRYAPVVAQVTAMGDDGSWRPDRVLKVEPKMIEIIGPEISELHVGRSSQDMHTTYRTAMLRDDVLEIHDALNGLLETFTALAETHRGVVVPSYTNGVAAQPNSLSHYFLGVSESLIRARDRLQELFNRANHSPMGSTVLNGTGWPLDRRTMADYLGFDGPFINALDAVHGAPTDLPIEFAQVMQSIALPIGILIQDIMIQYAQPRPWIILQEGGENTYASSAMPQKRNPGLMNSTRVLASSVCAGAVEMAFLMHNISVGQGDARFVTNRAPIARDTVKLIGMCDRVLKALRISPERALEELNNDWTATQEVADRLMANYGVPFRVGHHVASAMVGWARANNVRPLEFPYEKMQEIFRDVTGKEWHEMELPMSEAEFRDALDPHAIVENRKTEGGPQAASIESMLVTRRAQNETARAWCAKRVAQIDDALARLEKDFSLFL